jgi:transposase
MLTREDDVDAHALHARGWTISAIARHLGHDRKTIRAYLAGGRVAGERSSAGSDPFERFVDYVRERLREDPHLWASTLHDELLGLGFEQSYQTLTRQIRDRGLRPACETCRPAKGRPVAVIVHPPGEETQWDWVELPDPPAAWGWGRAAHLFVGALSHSGRWRAVLAESEDQPHVIDALDRVTRKLGGLTSVWRFDRMATVCHPATGRITASFAGVAKHYGVSVVICPPRHGNRKGVVEKANHTAAQRWWRTVADDVTVETAQASLDRLCAERFDQRQRVIGDERDTVAAHADRERLRPVPPVSFPATLSVERRVSANCRVAFRGNFYSVPPELAHSAVSVSARLGQPTIDIVTASGIVIARHHLAADGCGISVAEHGHVTALHAAALGAFSDAAPHRSKQRIPAGPAARVAAERLREADPEPGGQVIDLTAYVEAANGRNTLT